MKIVMDGDAMPRDVREILYRAAKRTRLPLVLVANQQIAHEKSPLISSIIVPMGPDEADDAIVEMVEEGDLVITADIPLADRVITRGGICIDPRGNLLTKDNIKERLVMRDFLSDMRESGIMTPGPSPFSQKDRKNFANELDRFLSTIVKGASKN